MVIKYKLYSIFGMGLMNTFHFFDRVFTSNEGGSSGREDMEKELVVYCLIDKSLIIILISGLSSPIRKSIFS